MDRHIQRQVEVIETYSCSSRMRTAKGEIMVEYQLILEYVWVFIVLIGLEGLLAADNALVMAVMVKHLPPEQRRKALFYGLVGALVLRFGSLFLISFLVDVWQVQAIGALYLLFISLKYLYGKATNHASGTSIKEGGSGFWLTVIKIEFADMAFAVDSILAAVALAVTLPATGLFTVGSLDGGQFIVIFAGGMIGVIIMRFAANMFVGLLQKRPALEVAAFVIVGWVGLKLGLLVLAHKEINLISEQFAQSLLVKGVFYGGLVAIALIGWFVSGSKKTEETNRG